MDFKEPKDYKEYMKKRAESKGAAGTHLECCFCVWSFLSLKLLSVSFMFADAKAGSAAAVSGAGAKPSVTAKPATGADE